MQEALGQIGIKATINKIPGANWRTELNKKVLPLYTNVFSGWLDYPVLLHMVLSWQELYIQYHELSVKRNGRFIDGAGAAASSGDQSGYEKNVKGFIDLAFSDVPRIPLYQPFSNVAMQKNVSGYQYWFHRRLDYRALVKG